MDDSEIREYAEVYEPQRIFSRAQESTSKEAMIAVTVRTGLLAKPGAAEIESVKRHLQVALGGLIETEIMVRAVNDKISHVLETQQSSSR